MSEKLTRFEKCEIALSKGITCDIEKGIVYGIRGEEITGKNNKGYININFRYNGKIYSLKAHIFIYYYAKGEYDESLDINHLNEIKDDNRIINLELATRRYNTEYSSENSNGYTGILKNGNKFTAKLAITIEEIKKTIYVGIFETPKIAHEHYKLAVIHERRLESFSTEHRKEFRNFIKELYNTSPEKLNSHFIICI
jgi:exonuclease III